MDVNYSYRRLGDLDTGLLREMLALFAEVFDEPETYLGAVPSEEYLRGLLRRTDFIALAALAEDEVVGGLAAYELEKFERERTEIYIYDLGVREGHRRRGVATALIEELRAIAREGKAWVIFVQADPGDEAAIELYGSLGVRERVYHFDIPIRMEDRR